MRFDTHNAYSELLREARSTSRASRPSRRPTSYPRASCPSTPDKGISVTSVGQAFVTDRTYADVTVHVTSASTPGACVVLRGTGGGRR